MLIAIAYTCTTQQGKLIAFKGVKEYICRLEENFRKDKRHSNFWVGLYGGLWIQVFQMCHDWVKRLMRATPNKLPFDQKGLRAKRLILSSF